MCGIFGITTGPQAGLDRDAFQQITSSLFRLSEARGKESCGFAMRQQDTLNVFKRPVAASELLKSGDYSRVLSQTLAEKIAPPFAFIGHSRLVTNGIQTINDNNQPVAKDGLVVIHNGIIVNDAQLWQNHSDLTRRYDVDTEVLLSLLGKYAAARGCVKLGVQQVFSEIRGAASIAVIFDDRPELLLATNTGSLYLLDDPQADLLLFASEESILQQLIASRRLQHLFAKPVIQQLPAGNGCLVNLEDRSSTKFSLEFSTGQIDKVPSQGRGRTVPTINHAPNHREAIATLKRCTRCILPESFPYIEFDAEGVCNHCRNYTPARTLGLEALKESLDPIRSKDGRPDCIVAFSGGRDSSYGLHYAKRVLGLNPIAYTYDWGMVTDLARRNQARICGQLGVEHILISANINQKRANVRKNIEAWLKKPDLGMIPLFMAGDKQFFYHANRVSKQTGISLILFSTCPYEVTHFKTAYCGLHNDQSNFYDALPGMQKMRLTRYYAMQYLKNPRYFNSSLLDTLGAYFSAFYIPHDYCMLFDYIHWDETEIESTLLDDYDWETSPDTRSTWRIGDGTAAFYNYIYYTVAGFTENDTFRSNQVRAGALSREEALRSSEQENQPRWESIEWYARTIGFDLHEAVRVINALPKHYQIEPKQIAGSEVRSAASASQQSRPAA